MRKAADLYVEENGMARDDRAHILMGRTTPFIDVHDRICLCQMESDLSLMWGGGEGYLPKHC